MTPFDPSAEGVGEAAENAYSDLSTAYFIPLVTSEKPAAGNVEAAAINATTAIKYYYFNGMRIAMRKGSSFKYLHGDHLGSTVLATKTDNTTESAQSYYAFGRKLGGGSLPTDHRFTGQKLDTTGLMYYNARYYDPGIGHFISPDTIVPDPTNVLDYNRYMYGLGNPVTD